MRLPMVSLGSLLCFRSVGHPPLAHHAPDHVRFCILTHPEMKPAIESRFAAIMGDGVPGSPGFV